MPANGRKRPRGDGVGSRLFPDERNLQVRRAIFFLVEAAVTAQVDPGHRHLRVWIGAVRDGQLESVVAEVLEEAGEIERPQAAGRGSRGTRAEFPRGAGPFPPKRLLCL